MSDFMEPIEFSPQGLNKELLNCRAVVDVFAALEE